MNEEELEVIRHLFCSLDFCHRFDDSYKITKEAKKHEKELFVKSIDWLAQFDKEHKVFVRDYKEKLAKCLRLEEE